MCMLEEMRTWEDVSCRCDEAEKAVEVSGHFWVELKMCQVNGQMAIRNV